MHIVMEWTLSSNFMFLQTYIKSAFVDILVSVSLSDLDHAFIAFSLTFHLSDISFNSLMTFIVAFPLSPI